MSIIQRFIHEESGATAIEYALIAALISIAAIAVMTGVGNQVRDTFQDVRSTLASANKAGAN